MSGMQGAYATESVLGRLKNDEKTKDATSTKLEKLYNIARRYRRDGVCDV